MEQIYYDQIYIQNIAKYTFYLLFQEALMATKIEPFVILNVISTLTDDRRRRHFFHPCIPQTRG